MKNKIKILLDYGIDTKVINKNQEDCFMLCAKRHKLTLLK